jgi:hypothetical protein
MSGLIMPSSYLYSDRKDEVEELLRPLRDGEVIWCDFVTGAIKGAIVISSGSHQPRKPDNFHDWRFRTKAKPDLWAHYYEVWEQLGGGKKCRIIKSYLHIYKKNGPNLDQIVCIHSDPHEQPSDPDDEKQRRQCLYKRGPHLHVVTAGELAKCHFPLNLGQISSVLSTIGDLTKAIADAVEIVRNEVIEIFADEPA